MSGAAGHRTGRRSVAVAACEAWIRGFVTLYLEVEAGRRPARHLRPMLAAVAEPELCARPHATLPAIRRIRVQLRQGACEAVVLLDDGHRVGALALALRRDAQGWVVVDVRRPDRSTQPRPATSTGVDVHPAALPTPLTWKDLEGDDQPGWRVPAGWRRDEAGQAAA